MTNRPGFLVVIDPSAIVAMATREPERDQFLQACLSAPNIQLSAAGYVEVALVLDNRSDPVLSLQLDLLLDQLGVIVVPVTPMHARLARQAHRDYGRGSGHPARLNFGDCFSYALSKESAEPLLFMGTDFAQTDITPAV